MSAALKLVSTDDEDEPVETVEFDDGDGGGGGGIIGDAMAFALYLIQFLHLSAERGDLHYARVRRDVIDALVAYGQGIDDARVIALAEELARDFITGEFWDDDSEEKAKQDEADELAALERLCDVGKE